MSFQLPASYVSKAHTVLASVAFLGALFVGTKLHYRKLVKNQIAGYPEEWWPSVSATIGDWYPERSIFQIFIALTAGPRFALILCWWVLTRTSTSMLPSIVAICGFVRSLSCGGWVFITSSDDHDTHDVLMITYIALNLPWMIGSIICTPLKHTKTRQRRKLVASLFFLAIVPLVYFFIQHKVHEIPGAYTKYSFCEWFLILSDIWFDSITADDFLELQISIHHLSPEKAGVKTPPLSSEIRQVVQSVPAKVSVKASQKLQPTSTTQVTKAHLKVQSTLRNIFRAKSQLLGHWRDTGSFVSDVYLSYVWWSVFTTLAPALFYFSVWQLSISGQEISLISTLSPILLGVSSLRAMFYTHSGRTWLQALLIIGLVAFVLEWPLVRLLAVTVANISGSLLKAIEWSDRKRSERHGIVLALGLMMSSLSKLVNHSVNPIWPIVDGKSGGWNKTGIILALFSVWEYSTRDAPGEQTVLSEKTASTPIKKSQQSSDDATTELTELDRIGLFSHWSLTSIGLGSLMFSLHCLLADSGTLIAWSWTGYPVTGPVPGVHGVLTLIAMAIGVLMSGSKMTAVISHPLWMGLGALSTYLMYTLRDWPGYISGLLLAAFLSSLTPQMIRLSAVHGMLSPGKVYFTAWIIVCLLDLANIWTVAYAFVPAGWLLRERTDIVLVMQMLGIGIGFIPAWTSQYLASSSLPSLGSTFYRQVKSLLVLLTLIAVLSTVSRVPGQTPIPHHAAQRMITTGIWTVHFGIDDSGRDSQYRMRDLIHDMELDVVGLLETDLHRIVFGNRDLTRLIAEDLGYYVDIGPGPNSHTWGAVLFSKFPILKSTHHLLPSPHGELAPAISAVLDVWGQNITVIVSHNGQEEDPLDRELQSAELARIMAEIYPDPVIFLGYVVTRPRAERPNPYEILVADGRVHDIEDEDWDRWCEYIFYRGVYRTAYARVSRSTITDTELQVGKFVIPKEGHSIDDISRDDRYLRTIREVYPASMWFPDEYLDSANPGGKRGHMYHVHPWPLYYKLPENAVV